MKIYNFSKTFSLLVFIYILTNNLQAQDSTRINSTGIYGLLNVGALFPIGNNKELGLPLSFGFNLDFRGDKMAVGFTFDIIGIGFFGSKVDGNLILNYFGENRKVNEFYGGLFTIDYSHQIYRTNTFFLDGVIGIGQGHRTYEFDKNNMFNISNVVVSLGINLRYFVNKNYFIQIKPYFCKMDIPSNIYEGNKLDGSFFVVKLLFSEKLGK